MIVMNMKWEGATPEQYEDLRKKVDWEGNVPTGAVLHVAAFTDDALKVTDVWESEADLNNFMQDRLMPAVKELGIPGEPKVKVHPVYALFTPAFEKR